MTQIKFADFEEGSDGASIATGFEGYSGTLLYEATGALKGSLSANVPSGTIAISTLQWSSMTPMGDVWVAGFFRPPAAPDASPWILSLISGRTAGTTQFKVDINVSGQIILRDGSTVVDTSTFTCDGSTPVRIAVNCDNAGNTITARLYYGANVDGGTPDEVLTGVYSGGDIDRVNIGMGTAQTAGIGSNLLMDNLTVDDATEPLLPTGVNGVASYDLTITHAADSDAVADRTYQIDATGSTGTVSLAWDGASRGTITESPTGVFTFSDPNDGDTALALILTAAGSGGGTDDTASISIARGGASIERPLVYTFQGGDYTDPANWA